MLSREVRAVAGNLVEAMRFFGRGREDAEVRDCPGVSLISCGLNYAAFNSAVFSAPVPTESDDLVQRIQTSAAHFEGLGLRWTSWLCEDFLDPALRRQLRTTFQRFGLSLLIDPPGLYADALLIPKRPLPTLQVRPVEDDSTRLAFAYITSVAFEIPLEICKQIYGSERAWAGSFKGYIGYVDGVPVTTAAVVVTGEVAGIYSVGTLPNFRRKGHAEAIMRTALESVKQRTGIEASVLQSTASGLSLYGRMGYRKMTRFRVYIS